ncbi:hypothetical protein FRB95_008156 [Tulasnella sp. JGI-2019a]|nr:hypothetical protein FRB95_008156 [Tulasnella sp. JGI-2019a]
MCSSRSLQSDLESKVISGVAEGVPFGLAHETEGCRSICPKLRLHSLCLPISKLPNELLVKIIYLSLYGLDDEYFIRLRTLSQVSTLWYDLVKHAPTLWGYAHSEHTTTEIELALRRSKGALIDVVYVALGGDERLLETVFQERSRWRSFKYESHSADLLLRYLNQGSFERLEEVDLMHSWTGEPPLLLENVSRRQIPRLRHLRLSNIVIAWDSDILSRLDTLSLTVHHYDFGPSIEQVIAILRASPGLTSFRLRCQELQPGAPYSPTIITLPKLHTLALFLEVWKTGQLLACLDVPLCRRFDLLFPREFPFGRDASKTFHTGGDKILSSMLTSAKKIHLNVSLLKAEFEWWTTSEDDGSWPLESTIHWVQPMGGVHPHLLELLPNYTLPVVRLVVDHDGTWSIHAMTPLLSTLPSVITLVVKTAHPRDLILDLSSPQSSPSKGWLLPRLQSLEISVVPADRDLLLGMVQARHGGIDLAKLAEVDGALPSRLKSIAVMGFGWKDVDLTYLRENLAEVDWSIVI